MKPQFSKKNACVKKIHNVWMQSKVGLKCHNEIMSVNMEIRS